MTDVSDQDITLADEGAIPGDLPEEILTDLRKEHNLRADQEAQDDLKRKLVDAAARASGLRTRAEIQAAVEAETGRPYLTAEEVKQTRAWLADGYRAAATAYTELAGMLDEGASLVLTGLITGTVSAAMDQNASVTASLLILGH